MIYIAMNLMINNKWVLKNLVLFQLGYVFRYFIYSIMIKFIMKMN